MLPDNRGNADTLFSERQSNSDHVPVWNYLEWDECNYEYVKSVAL